MQMGKEFQKAAEQDSFTRSESLQQIRHRRSESGCDLAKRPQTRLAASTFQVGDVDFVNP
jgi:hypothetical protein